MDALIGGIVSDPGVGELLAPGDPIVAAAQRPELSRRPCLRTLSDLLLTLLGLLLSLI